MGTVSSVFRRVQVLPEGKGRTWKTLAKGDKVRVSDWIRTGPRGRARIELADRYDAKNAGPTVLNVGPSSELELEKYEARFQRPEKSQGIIGLIRGTVRAFTKNWGSGSAFSVRVGTSLCGIRGSEVQVFAGVPRAPSLGGAPFQGGDPSNQGRPANVSCFSGDCFAFPMPQGFGGGLPGPGNPQLVSIDPMNQLVMGNSNDPRTWRQVPLTPQKLEQLLDQTGVPGSSQGQLEDTLFQRRFGSGGGAGPGTPGPQTFLPPSQLGGGPGLNLPPGPGGQDGSDPLPPGGHWGASSNRAANDTGYGGGALTQGGTFHDNDTDVFNDDDTDPGGGPLSGGDLHFADGFIDVERAAGWNGGVRPDTTQYQMGLASLQRLGQAIVDGNLKAFMDAFSPNATQDTSIFRNGFLDDLQQDQNSTVNLDFEVFEYRLAGSAWSGGTLIVRLRWLLTINGTQVQTGTARVLFDRESGFRIISWLGAAPFGRNDPQVQAQVAAGDPNAESSSVTSGGSTVGLQFIDAPLSSNDQTALLVDADSDSTAIINDISFNQQTNVSNNGPSGTDFGFDVQSIDFNTLILGTLAGLSGSSASGAEQVFRCEFDPAFSSLGSVGSFASTFQNLSFSVGAVPVDFDHTFAFRTVDGRWGLGYVRVQAPSGSPPKTITVTYQYKLASEANNKLVDPSKSGVCNQP